MTDTPSVARALEFAPIAGDFDLFVEVSDCAKFVPNRPISCLGVGFFRFRVDATFLPMLERRHKFCRSEEVLNFEDSSYVNETEIGTVLTSGSVHEAIEDWRLLVDKDSFRLEGSSNAEVLVEFTGMKTALLVGRINGSVNETLPTNYQEVRFKMYGGCLFYATDHMADLIEHVTKAHPEVAAKQVSIEMADRIREAGVDISGAATPVKAIKRNQMII